MEDSSFDQIKKTIENLKLAIDPETGVFARIEELDMVLEMDGYRSTLKNIEDIEKPRCGTSMCFVGGCPLVEGLKPSGEWSMYHSDHTAFYWNGYCSEIFPAIPLDCTAWEYLFDANNPNDPEELTARAQNIICYLETHLERYKEYQ